MLMKTRKMGGTVEFDGDRIRRCLKLASRRIPESAVGSFRRDTKSKRHYYQSPALTLW